MRRRARAVEEAEARGRIVPPPQLTVDQRLKLSQIDCAMLRRRLNALEPSLHDSIETIANLTRERDDLVTQARASAETIANLTRERDDLVTQAHADFRSGKRRG
jgi:uncharacterized coiled-coil DUF342 family protein